MFRAFCRRQQPVELHRQQHGVDHLVFGCTGMDVSSFEMYSSQCCIKVFKLQFSDFATIHGISKISIEFFHIKMIGASSDLFIGCKGHTNGSMLYFRVLFQPLQRRYDLGNSGFIVGSQQGGSVGGDDVLTFVVRQFREIDRGKDNVFFLVQNNISTVVVLVN